MSSAYLSPDFNASAARLRATGILSVALIGPHEPRRSAVAGALLESRTVSFREFDSYPEEIATWHRLAELFDVIMLDLDSDPDLALGMVEEIHAHDGATIIVFSQTADRNQALRFMRAGVREYLLLPLQPGAVSEALVRATTLRPKLVTSEKSPGNVNSRGDSETMTRTFSAGVSAVAEVRWPNPEPICYGDKLSPVQLNATASVPGSFVYTPRAGYVLPTGTHTLWVTFTPEGSDDDALQISVPIVVEKAAPVLSWPEPAEISFGTGLSERQLNATAAVAGRFEYSPASGAVLPPGTHTLTATFIPADTANYIPAHAKRSIVVSREAPVLEWAAPAAITYGTALGGQQLSAKASVAGSFDYVPGPGAVLAAGQHTLVAVFTPADAAKYTKVQKAVSLLVNKATPAITWPIADAIPHGRALGASQLNAQASVEGSFAYTPGLGEVLPPGTHQLKAVFTPFDTLNYTAAQAVAQVVVAEKLPSSIHWPAPAAISYGTALSAAQLNASAPVPGTFIYTPAAGNVLAPGRYTLAVAFVPTEGEKYATARATVELEVKALPDHPSSSVGTPGAQAAPSVTAHGDRPSAGGSESSSEAKARETRVYKGAVYEKGEDGQWHLQKK